MSIEYPHPASLGDSRVLDFTSDVPAVDDHSHASYKRPGQKVESFLERQRGLNYVESKVPFEVWQRLTAARAEGDQETYAAIDAEYGIEALIDKQVEFKSTTFAASTLLDGARQLYGDHSVAELARIGKEWQLRDPVGLYDRALVLANTPMVLTDVPQIDHGIWPAERYRPIGRIDPYLYPFGHPRYDRRGGDTPRFRNIFSWVLDMQRDIAGLDELPSSLGEYETFVEESLRRRRSEGFVGLKIASAYVRSLRFLPVDGADADAAYKKLHSLSPTEPVDPAAYITLADHLVYRIGEIAIELELPLQIHTGAGHAEPGLRLSDANPLNLEALLDSPRLNQLQVILIHGGYPYSSYLSALAMAHGNVYLDFSMMPNVQYATLYRVLEEWLEYLPADKVIFGSDTEQPEHHVAGTHRARHILNKVLTSGVTERIWSMRQAGYLAERVLHRNLCELYQVELPAS